MSRLNARCSPILTLYIMFLFLRCWSPMSPQIQTTTRVWQISLTSIHSTVSLLAGSRYRQSFYNNHIVNLLHVNNWSVCFLDRPTISQVSCRRLPPFYFDYRLTDIGDSRQLRKKYKQTSYFEMYAYNCNPRRTLRIYPLFLLCNPSLGISTWQEVFSTFYWTVYTAERLPPSGHSVYTADRLQPSGL